MLTAFLAMQMSWQAGRTVGTISGRILFAGQHATKTFLRRYTGYVEQFGEQNFCRMGSAEQHFYIVFFT